MCSTTPLEHGAAPYEIFVFLEKPCPPPRRSKTKIAFELILLFSVYFIGPCDMG